MNEMGRAVEKYAKLRSRRYLRPGTNNDEIYMDGFRECYSLFMQLIDIVDKNTDNVERFIDELAEKLKTESNQ